jgi:class 3 adenylate cyclase
MIEKGWSMSGAPGPKVQRHLAAILAADVEGYSRLMNADEVGTLRTLTAHREIMDRLIEEHGGRIANTAGIVSLPSSRARWRRFRPLWTSRRPSGRPTSHFPKAIGSASASGCMWVM